MGNSRLSAARTRSACSIGSGWPGQPSGVGCKSSQPMVGEFKARMLASDDKSRRLAEVGERMGNRAELDGFGTRSDNERDTILAQLSPWLRRAIVAEVGAHGKHDKLDQERAGQAGRRCRQV